MPRTSWRRWLHRSRSVPTLALSDDDCRQSALPDRRAAKAAKEFERSGALLVTSALRVELVEECQQAFVARYTSKNRGAPYADALPVGHERYMFTVDICPPFNTIELYANRFVYPILLKLLGRSLVLNSFGCVCAFPGSEAQHVHLDHPWLFETPRINEQLRPYAITVLVPLIDIDDAAGGTAVWVGSHRGQKPVSCDPEEAISPMPHMGDMLLMDYRVVHAGRANNSPRARPLLYLVYSRPWFRDTVNFGRQSPISIQPDERDRVDPAYRSLFRYVERDSSGR